MQVARECKFKISAYFNLAQESNLKEIFNKREDYWRPVFKSHMQKNELKPTFSTYKKLFENDAEKGELSNFSSLT